MEVEELLERIDILEYISQYCDFEERNGEWWALSPFKEEKTPSFSVNTEKQRFYDFSSGAYGNLIHFVRRYHQCGFQDAVDKLIKYANIEDADRPATSSLSVTKVAKRFKRQKRESKESASVILSDDHMDRYEFDKEKLTPWFSEGIGWETMKRFSVSYDSFSDRIVFPIRSYDGKIINVCGRTMDPEYKEKKLRKYTYFHPLGILDTLYGYSDNAKSIRDSGEIILVEGAKSVMLAHEWGVTNTAAILTSHLNPHQLLFLIKLGCRVVFALDEDVDILDDPQIKKLCRYVSVEWVKNHDGLLKSKMAPVDAGKHTWNLLYERRIPIN